MPGRFDDADAAAAADAELQQTLRWLRAHVEDRPEAAARELGRALLDLDDQRGQLIDRFEVAEEWGGGGAGLHGANATDTALAGLVDLLIRVRALATAASRGDPEEPTSPSTASSSTVWRRDPKETAPPAMASPPMASPPTALTEECLEELARVAAEPLPRPIRMRSRQRDVLDELRRSSGASDLPPGGFPPFG